MHQEVQLLALGHLLGAVVLLVGVLQQMLALHVVECHQEQGREVHLLVAP